MNIIAIYEQYRIMPNLQDHMLRVAGVASIICDHCEAEIDRETVITTSLIHDMGNIIKFDLTFRPEFLEPRGLGYWQNVKADYIKKYGNDEHDATLQIAKELRVSDTVIDLISRIGFSKSEQNFKSDDYNIKICAYADSRVAIDGIVSLRRRHFSSRKRFEKNKKQKSNSCEFMKLYGFSEGMETQIFERCDIKPEFITDKAVEKKMKLLRGYDVTIGE